MAQKRDPRDTLFRAAESAERAFNRKKAGELRQSAREAQQQKNWALAESLWRQSLQGDPGDRSATVGLANALVTIGKLGEAGQFAATIVANWPEDENGPTILARLAEARGDTASAIRHWREARVLSPAKTQVLVRLGRLLMAAGIFAEARGCAERLSVISPDSPAGGMLLADIAAAEGDGEGALARRKAMAETFPENAQVLRDLGRALLAAGDFAACNALIERLMRLDRLEGLRLRGQLLAETEPDADHIDFWRQAQADFPHDADFVRKYLNAALHAGRSDEAFAAMTALLGDHIPRASDARFLVSLLNILIARGDHDGVRHWTKDLLKQLKGTRPYRAASLRLSRIVFGYFPRTPRRPAAPPTRRFARMLAATPGDSRPLAVLGRIVAWQERLAASNATCLFDSDIAREECFAFVTRIRGKLTAREPFSFIRLGDGEANAFEYEPAYAARFADDASEREMTWWGRALDDGARAALAKQVRSAIANADALGLPLINRFLRDVVVDRPEDLSMRRSGRGLLAILRAMEDGETARTLPRLLVSAHLHQDLQRWDAYPALLAGVDAIAVSCHAGLADAMRARFGVTLSQNVLIPPRYASLAAFGRAEAGSAILPEVMDRVPDDLGDDLRGRLVIVGAGYAGKSIIEAARTRGAVALDLGSIFDYWLGAKTRSTQDIG